ncbi:histone deacetylase [Sarcoptes scabiei]|nr:histone deacetylase [Sarcoptes scabiei]
MADLIASDDNYNFDELVRESQAKIDLEIAQQFPLVADLMSISKLHEEYAEEDQVYQKKVKDLEEQYSHLRKTRPDGNCFYRAFIFAYFESLFGDQTELDRFIEICHQTRKDITSLGFPDFTVDEFYDYFQEIISMIQNRKIKSSDDLLIELDKSSVSDNIVVYLRLLTSYYLQKECEFFINFTEGSGQMSEFCKREVEPMYKESDHVHIIALCSVLNVEIRVVYMDRGAGGKVNIHDFVPIHSKNDFNKPRIHLLYRPGHYDILYLKK